MEDRGRVVGVDGARGGWLAVAWDGQRLSAELARRWQDVALAGALAVGVDMPIGLADRGGRCCDRAARARLPKGRRSSVFSPPRRYMLNRPYAEANADGKAVEGVGLAKQAWYIGLRIAELDAVLTAADQDRVYEVHPELIFHNLNGWSALPPKKTAAGQRARLELLHAAGVPDPSPLLSRFPRSAVKPDDVLDAAACALAARRIARGEAVRLPTEKPPRDARGLRMEIWY